VLTARIRHARRPIARFGVPHTRTSSTGHVLTGEVHGNRTYPDGVRILSVDKGEVLLQAGRQLEKIAVAGPRQAQ
jgi:hypothetical protein